MTLKSYVIGKVKAEDYYAARFPAWNPKVKGNVKCPFHDDSKPSLAVALKNGGAKCHASTCSVNFGNIVHFEATLKGLKENMAAIRLYREFVRPVIPFSVIQKYRINLSENQIYLLKLRKEMGLNLQSIRRYSLGLDLKTHRITIPIYDQWDQCVNLRFYRLPSERTKGDQVKTYNLAGHGQLDLFPFSAIKKLQSDQPIFFMAGEKDCLLANTLGLSAITSTNGEGSWSPIWNDLFTKRVVYLVFDRDAGGDAGAIRIENFLRETTAIVKRINLPFVSKRVDYKDFTDWILKEKHNVDELKKYIATKFGRNGNAPAKFPPSVQQVWDGKTDLFGNEETDGSGRTYPKLPGFYTDQILDLASISSRSELLNQHIKSTGIVAAKSPNTYSIPWKFTIQIANRPVFSFEIPMGRDLLSFIRCTDSGVLQRVQNLVGSNKAQVIPTHYLTATEVEVIPTDVVDRDVPYVVQRCYYFGDRIESNTPYYLEIIPTSEIRSQETLGIITKYTPLSKSIDKFEMTPETQANLSAFRPEGEGVWKKLTTLANEISHNYTRVRNRLDLHLIALLTWASPIRWRFPADPELQRGWLNSLVLGDTETGKSKVAINLRELFNCGVFVNSENCTFVGLVGGAIKMGSGQLMLRWGRIPLSDRQLVVLEEISGLSVDEISKLSDLRSSGTARLDKGGISASTKARTRLLCLSNVRSERRGLANYLYGVYAVRELIGHGEDIARFDLITTLVDREVSTELINSKNFASNANEQRTVTTSDFQSLIHFIWSLTPEQIEFTNEAYDACLEYTKELSTQFHPSIPVFKGGSGRYKLGRISAAIACLQFAWDDERKKVIVSTQHVEASVHLLKMLYNKPSLGYKQYSQQMFDRETIKDEIELAQAFTEKLSKSKIPSVLETLIHQTRFTRDELCAVGGFTSLHADQLIGAMVRNRALRKGEANIWEIEPAGKLFMEGLMRKYGPRNSPSKLSNNHRKSPPRKLVGAGRGPTRVS